VRSINGGGVLGSPGRQSADRSIFEPYQGRATSPISLRGGS